MNQTFDRLSTNSRIWIFQSDRIMNSTEIGKIQSVLDEFIPKWAAHGNELYGGYQVLNNLFLIIGVDEAKSPASGCSIDSLTRVVKELGGSLNIDFFNRLAIAFENKSNEIEIVSMNEFKRLAKENEVGYDTIVFNNLVANKGEFETKWRTSVKNSWHSNLFELV